MPLLSHSNKCYKIINQLVVGTLKGNNYTRRNIFSVYFVTDNFKEYDLDTEYINMLYVKAEAVFKH
jgi:hypothetical protein